MSGASSRPAPVRPARAAIVLAFAAVWLIWGSTYLGIRVVLETLPPFTMATIRFLVAGGILFGWALFRGAKLPRLRDWKPALLLAALLILGGHGAVIWAEQRISSGLAALLVAVEPLWIVLLQLHPSEETPPPRVWAGVLVGFAGLVLLVAPWETGAARDVDVAGALVVVLGALSWAVGSLAGRKAPLPEPAALGTGMQMLSGAALLFLAALVRGEPARIAWHAVSARSLLALAYLAIFGSLVAFSAYVFLMKNTPPALASTYAFVNPIVALFLGWVAAGEVVTPRMLVAAAVILGAVVLITLSAAEKEGEAEHP